MWTQLGLESEPFDKGQVHYLLPHGKHTANTGKPNSHSTPNIPHDIYAYALSNARDKLDLLMGHVPDVWDTLRALIGTIQEGLTAGPKDKRWGMVKTWSGLLDGPPLYEVGDGKQKQIGEARSAPLTAFGAFCAELLRPDSRGCSSINSAETPAIWGKRYKPSKAATSTSWTSTT